MKTKIKKPKKSADEIMLDGVYSAIDSDYHYDAIDVDYNRVRNCEMNGCNDICRCAKIVDFEITNINLGKIANRFSSGINEPILAYCISRLPTLFKLYDDENFEADLSGGYYGEELCSIKIRRQEPIRKAIDALWKLSDKERIEFVLNKEYGYIADTLKNVKNYVVKEVGVDSLRMPPESHMHKLDTDHIAKLEDSFKYELPIGIYLPRGENIFSVSDGRHRLTAAKNLKLNKVKIIVGE